MTASRKGYGAEDKGMTEADYMEEKKECQERSGYPVSDTEMSQKAVDEKLPMGSQSY